MIRVGIIGSGFGLYGLLPAFNTLENCHVVSICGEKTERLVNYCKSIGLKNIYIDWQLMLREEKLDAIALAVTPNAQYQIAKTAIEKGIHIFAEKPLTTSYLQAKELLSLAKKKKITHAIDFIFPEINAWEKVKQMIDNKMLGELQYISVNWNFLSYDIKNEISSWKTDIAQGGGALSFFFSHTLYYIEYFVGEITDVKSLLTFSSKNLNGGEVGVDILIKFINGINGYAHISCNMSGIKQHQLIFQCEKGTIVLENKNSITNNFTIQVYTENGIENIDVLKEAFVNVDEDERVAIVRKIARRFVDSCIKKTKCIPSFSDAVRVQELIEKIRKDQI